MSFNYKVLGQTLSGVASGTWANLYTVPSGKCFVGNVYGTHITTTSLYIRNRINGVSADGAHRFWLTSSAASSYSMARIAGKAGDVIECGSSTAEQAAVTLMGVEMDISEGFAALAILTSSSTTTERTVYTTPAGKVVQGNLVIVNDSGTDRNLTAAMKPNASSWAVSHRIWAGLTVTPGAYSIPNIILPAGYNLGITTGGANVTAMFMGRLMDV